jgi:aspartate racemase
VKPSSVKTVGVLGGMGPDTTVDFMARVIALTPTQREQDHVRMIVDHNPRCPSRQDAMLRDGEDPGPTLAAMAAGLETAGADFLVMPCNTAHAFRASIEAATTIPLVSIIDVTVSACANYKAVGVLATSCCLDSHLYQNALAKNNIQAVIPDDEEVDLLLNLINRVKTGDRSSACARQLQILAESLTQKGAKAIVAGCTEIPLLLHESMLSVPLISSTDVLAGTTVRIARGELPLD